MKEKMKAKKRLELKEKGWSGEEIRKAEAALEKTGKDEAHFSLIVFWSALVVIIFANLVVSLVMIPFLIVLNQIVLYALIVILAGTIGFLYNFLITDIGYLKRKHHLWAGIIIPLLALANVAVMVLVSNRLITDLQVNNPPHNAWLAAVIFAAAFILPYVIDQIRLRFSRRAVPS